MERSDLINRFGYHPPENEGVKQAHELIRDRHLELASDLDAMLPDSRELSLAVTKLEESMMWANAALARHRAVLGPAGYGLPDWERR